MKLAGKISQRKSAKQAIELFKENQNVVNISQIKSPKKVWWAKFDLLLFSYALWKEHFILRIPARVSIGHEISGLFQKK